MKPKYLETYHFRKLEEYCSIKCVNIVYEQQGTFGNEKSELRGKYKGYLYCKKLFSTLLRRNKSVMNYEIYNHMKQYKALSSQTWGEDKALYDVMNLLCNEF